MHKTAALNHFLVCGTIIPEKFKNTFKKSFLNPHIFLEELGKIGKKLAVLLEGAQGTLVEKHWH